MNKKKNYVKIIICIVVVFIIAAAISSFVANSKVEEIPYTQAREKISNLEITNIDLSRTTGIAKLYSKDSDLIYETKIPNIEVFCTYMEGIIESQKNNEQDLIEFRIVEKTVIFKQVGSFILYFLQTAISFFIIFFLLNKFMNRIQLFGGKEEEIKPVDVKNVSFKDIAGIDKELEEVKEVVLMLKHPEKYKEIGATIPKGILLTGEPGTGKTLIAKAIATEAGVNFYNCAGSNFDNMFVGVGASKVRELFEVARQNAPSIIFVDEIDAIAQSRYSYNSHSEQTLNQLLAEMDGFDNSENVIVIAATNHPEILDSAITRAGRFDRIIEIPLPDKKGRKEILEVHARNKVFEEGKKEEIISELSKKTSGMSGADLSNILNEAAIIAIKSNRNHIIKDDIDEAFIRVIVGISKEDKEISDKEKFLVAIHEAGHTITSRIKNKEHEILQVSIIPRGTAGGYTLFSDSEQALPNIEDLKNELVVSLGGRAAEEYRFKTISIGASADLKDATVIAHSMIYQFAMGTGTQMVQVYGHDEYNKKLEDKMFPDMESLIKEGYEDAKQIMENNKDLLEELANTLVEKSTLDSSELEELFSKYGI